MAVSKAAYLREPDYLSVSVTHFFLDVLTSSRSLMVAILAASLGLTNAQVGIALLLYNVGNALTQPFFGLWADRIGSRKLVIGGTLWMIVFFGIAAVAPDWPALIAITVAGIGSGAFHPPGTMVASQASTTNRTQATAVFFMAGQVGLFAGPVLAGILLEWLGRPGYVVLPAVAVVALISSIRWLQNVTSDRPESTAVATSPRRLPTFWRRIFALVIIIMTINTISFTTINFAPKLFIERGYDPLYVGMLGGLIMLGSAVGGFFGGMLADRWNGRMTILLAAVLAILPVYLYVPVEGAGRFLLLLLAGFFIGMPHSVLVLMMQGLLPGRRAFASGLTLGFMFFSGSVGSYFVGLWADQYGLALALQYIAGLLIFTILAALLLPRETAPAMVKLETEPTHQLER